MKKMYLFVTAIVVMLFVSLSYAQQATCHCNENKTTKMRVTQFLHWLDSTGNFAPLMTQAEINKYFAADFKKYTNGKVVATDNTSFYQRYLLAKKLYQSMHIQFPLQAVVVHDNQADLKYEVIFVDKKGKQIITQNTGTITFNQDGKVIEFANSFAIGDPLKSTH